MIKFFFNMTHLAVALKKHYEKRKKRILFANGTTLQELSLSMWQDLGYVQIDSSVLSRVLKGERLFTPQQLFIFCKILDLPHEEVEHLFHCWMRDHLKRDGVEIERAFVPTKEVVNLLDSYLKEAAKSGLVHTAATKALEFLGKLEEYKPMLSH